MKPNSCSVSYFRDHMRLPRDSQFLSDLCQPSLDASPNAKVQDLIRDDGEALDKLLQPVMPRIRDGE